MPRRSNKAIPSYSPLYPRMARGMARIGAEREQIAEAFGVSVETFQEWVKEHRELAEAIAEGEMDARAAVEKALFKRATGYSQLEEKAVICKGEVIVVTFMKHYPPDVAAAKLWLANHESDLWQEKPDPEHGVTTELADVMKRIRGQEPRAKSQEPRAKSQEPRAKSQEPRAKSQEPRATR
ncbi:helix-turn-helix domain-containing protein [Luteolibacter luteus]|uniref:Helix-turn-helix domain-containing protein n=1 Tax=Luteolibacter luteus TaxID=2728835 RepID=A0A858RNU1_9BACT|nr:helix-turn-helix domain-containing protein [Luteolibacter luteus]QJE99106.1 helix-turn-helix domain-containing protein [Luteolibacter luteus]